MAATRRLQKELTELKKKTDKRFTVSLPKEENVLQWHIILSPQEPPFNKGSFQIEVNFPAEYPFKPPKIQFKTKIYHPNIDEKGQICLPLISPENWKPATKSEQVLNALMTLITYPEPEHPLRGDLAEEYTRDKKRFDKNAADYTVKNALPRPSCS